MGQQRPHVPYRNSMMTQVLRDSLGGNCRTVMIANITAQHEQLDESISTCRFAQRVAMVSNQVWYPPCTNLAKEKQRQDFSALMRSQLVFRAVQDANLQLHLPWQIHLELPLMLLNVHTWPLRQVLPVVHNANACKQVSMGKHRELLRTVCA